MIAGPNEFARDAQDLLPDMPLEVVPIFEVIDGQEVIVLGEPTGCAEYNHIQGDNNYGFQGTCGLVSCEDVLRQFGLEVTEADVVDLAVAQGWCEVSTDPARSGGTREYNWVEILEYHGIPAHMEQGQTLEGLAEHVEANAGVIVGLNAEAIWGDPLGYAFSGGVANHAVTVTGVARDPDSGEIVGFFINDSNDADGDGLADSARFIDAATIRLAWESAGGSLVTTDISRPR